MKYETAGDPMSDLKWTRKTTQKIAEELKSAGIEVSKTTVGNILKKLGYSLNPSFPRIYSFPTKFTSFEKIKSIILAR